MAERVREGLIDALSGMVLVVMGIVGLVSLGRNPTLAAYDFGTDPGPVLLPRLLLLILLAGGVVVIGLAARRLHAAGPDLPALRRSLAPGRHIRPAAFVAALAVYLAALSRLGFVAATLLFGAGWIAALTPAEDRRPMLRYLATTAGAALVITAVLYYVFKGFVKVPLP